MVGRISRHFHFFAVLTIASGLIAVSILIFALVLPKPVYPVVVPFLIFSLPVAPKPWFLKSGARISSLMSRSKVDLPQRPMTLITLIREVNFIGGSNMQKLPCRARAQDSIGYFEREALTSSTASQQAIAIPVKLPALIRSSFTIQLPPQATTLGNARYAPRLEASTPPVGMNLTSG